MPAPDSSSGDSVRDRLQKHLRIAMKARDKTATAVLRATLAAIGNAEAVDASAAGETAVASGRIAGAVSGLGAGEVARRELSEADFIALVEREIDEHLGAADEYDRVGRGAEARELRAQCDVLRRVLN